MESNLEFYAVNQYGYIRASVFREIKPIIDLKHMKHLT